MPVLRIEYHIESFVEMKKDEIVYLLKYLESIGLHPLKYGVSQARPKFEYNPERKMDVADSCYEEGFITVKGKDFSIDLGVKETFAKPHLQLFKIKVTPKVNPQKLIDIGVKLYSIFKACYGFACLDNFYGYGTPGRSIEDCIFGFSWLNFFGKPYMEMWQNEKILKAPAIVTNCDDFVIIMLSQNPFIENDDINKKNDELKLYFGLKYFYDDKFERQKVSFNSIKEIIEYQDMLNKTKDYIAPDFHKYYNYRSNNKSFFAVQKGIKKIYDDIESLKENQDVIIEEI